LINHLEDVNRRQKFCNPIITALLESMRERFDGIIQRVTIPTSLRSADEVRNLPFGCDIYILATFVDPKFKVRWIDNKLKISDADKDNLRKEIKGMFSTILSTQDS
jgi:hypothetical protein